MLHTWQFDRNAVIGHEIYILCFMHSLSTMILKHQQRKEADSASEENASWSAAFPRRLGSYFRLSQFYYLCNIVSGLTGSQDRS